MAFNPILPIDGSEIDAAELRDQLNALNNLIAAQAAQIAGLTAALANTAQNPSVSQMALGLSDPPSQVQLQAIYDTLNTLINQLVRV